MSDWSSIHEEIVTFARDRGEQAHRLGQILRRAHAAKIWEPLGMASFADYTQRYLGLSARQTEDRLRIALALEDLPRLDAALAGGDVHYSAVRELTRVVVRDTEDEWMEKIRDRTVGDIQELVSGRKPGDRPSDPPGPRRHKIVVEMSAAVYALYRDAQAQLRKDCDEAIDDEDALMLMSRMVLGGPTDAGRSPYQIRVTVCEGCGRAEQTGRGLSIPVEPEAAEQALCDAQCVDDSEQATQTIPPAMRRKVVDRQHGRCGVPGCRMAVFTEVHHIRQRDDGGDHDPDLMLVLCGAHHRARHAGALRIEGSWPTGVTFMHADGSPYGAVANARLAGLMTDLYSGLRHLGFKERECRALVARVRPHVGGEATFQDVFFMAMREARTAGARHPEASP